MPSTVKIACYVYNGVGFTEDAVFTSGQVLFGDTIFDIDNCKMRIAHSIIEPSYDFNERKKMILLFPEKYITFLFILLINMVMLVEDINCQIKISI